MSDLTATMTSMQKSSSTGGGSGFINHVFNFDEDSKAEILNVIQYSFLAIIPVVMLNKSIQRFIPEADPDKGSVEILAEILLQLLMIFVGIIFIHRIITFVPTYSRIRYDSFNLVNVIIGFLVILMSIQTKLGMKINILTDRVYDLWTGNSSAKDDKKKNGSGNNNVRVSQPLAGPGAGASVMHVPPQMDHFQNMGDPAQRQPRLDTSQMYAGPSNPLVGANLPGASEPVAANFFGPW